MLRVVLSVALAAALLAAVAPALDDARATRTERLTERELGRVETATLTLAREEEPGARRTLSVSLPSDSPTTAQLAFVALGGVPNGVATPDGVGGERADTADGDVFAYRVAGGRTRVCRIEADLRVVREGEIVESDSRALVFRGDGTYRLRLRLVRVGDRPTVLVTIASDSGPRAS